MSGTERLYRLFARLYPRDIQRHTSEMWAVIERRQSLLASRGKRWLALRVWVFILRDLCRTLPAAHLAAWRRKGAGRLLHDFARNARYAVRSLNRSPGFAAIVIGTLAVAIGANTAIFSVVNSVLLKPLPYPEPDRIVRILTVRDGEVARTAGVSRLDFDDWVGQTSVFEHAAVYRYRGDAITGGDEPVHVDGSPVSEGFFEVLGSQPTHGRFFLPDEFEARAQVVVLSHGLWRRQFGSDASVVGRSIQLDGTPYEVIGVGPERFTIGFPERGVMIHEMWTPLADDAGGRGRDVYWAIGRLRPGVTIEQAARRLDEVSRRLSVTHPDTNDGLRAIAVPLHEWQVRNLRGTLLFAFASALLVLAVAVANVAGLMLGRAADRRGELGVRVSLGASRGDLVRQLMTESAVLAGMGGVLGVGLAFRLRDGLQVLFAGSGPLATWIAIDARVLGFSLVVCVLSALLFGSGPAFHATRNAYRHVPVGGRSSTSSLRRTRFRSLLVVTEVALSVVLLMGAALLTRSLWQLTRVDPGVNTDVLTFRLRPLGLTGESETFYAEVHRRLGELPGVEGVASVNYGTMTGRAIEGRFGRPDDAMPDHRGITRLISPGYLDVMGIPLLHGRAFETGDVVNSLDVVLVNRTLSERLWLRGDAVGKMLRTGSRPEPFEVIGVVGDVKHQSLAEVTPPMIYMTFAQVPRWNRNIVVRTELEAASLMPAVRREVWAVDPDAPIIEAATLEEIVAHSTSSERIRFALVALSALVALFLVSVGIYGIVGSWVSQRRREMAIRLALGAKDGGVRLLVLRDGLRLILYGFLLGLPVAYAVSGVWVHLLFGVSRIDPWSLVILPVVFLLLGLTASYGPARAATRVDIVTALTEG